MYSDPDYSSLSSGLEYYDSYYKKSVAATGEEGPSKPLEFVNTVNSITTLVHAPMPRADMLATPPLTFVPIHKVYAPPVNKNRVSRPLNGLRDCSAGLTVCKVMIITTIPIAMGKILVLQILEGLKTDAVGLQ